MNDLDEKPAAPQTGSGQPQQADFEPSGSGASLGADNGPDPVEKPRPVPPAPKPVVKKVQGSASLTDKDSVIETIKTVVYALLIALVIRTFLFQPFNIPSGSMESTLLVGDYIFVEKFAYGYSRYSFPWGLGPIPGDKRIWMGNGPKRGDVVVFKLPVDNSTDYIKRVIGLPGDRVQVRQGVVYLNGKPLPRERVPDYVDTDTYGDGDDQALIVPGGHYVRYRETLPGGKSYITLALDTEGRGANNNTGVYIVPAGHYFMMGDNRDNSLDSRFSGDLPEYLPDGTRNSLSDARGVGFVPAKNLVGKAEFIFFSNDGPLWKLWRWPWSIRLSRMFSSID